MSIAPDIDKEFILDRVSEEEIFSKYLGFPVKPGDVFCSPLREDKNPSCSLKLIRGRLSMRDYSGHFWGDCFDLVQYIYTCNFFEACLIMAQDFNLVKGRVKPRIKREVKSVEREETVLDVKFRDWNSLDDVYWEGYGISRDLLSFYDVRPLDKVWINKRYSYSYKEEDPAYDYYFAKGRHKVYYPSRDSYRFQCNTDCIQGFRQLPEKGDECVITKSLKDVMVLNTLGVAACAPQSETVLISKEFVEHLRTRFDKLYSLFDFDLTGVRTANKMRKIYGIEPIFITNGRFGTMSWGGKDISDLIKNQELAV